MSEPRELKVLIHEMGIDLWEWPPYQVNEEEVDFIEKSAYNKKDKQLRIAVEALDVLANTQCFGQMNMRRIASVALEKLESEGGDE